MTPANLFTLCGQALCGAGLKWKEQLAAMLMVQTNTVDNWSKGTSRIPPAVWRELEVELRARTAVIGDLLDRVGKAIAAPVESVGAGAREPARDLTGNKPGGAERAR